MKANFNDCLNRVLKDEGGYSNVPGDNGGPTNFGITLGDYRKYISNSGTAKDVKNMSVDQAKTIYRQKYWNALGCDDLPSGVDYTCFDYGVNSGLGRPRADLKKFKTKPGKDLINAINDERLRFLQGLASSQQHDQQFLKGWTDRVRRVRQSSLAMAAAVPQTPKSIAGAFAGVVAFFATGYHWALEHKLEVAAIVVGTSLAAYLIVHFITKKTNGS